MRTKEETPQDKKEREWREKILAHHKLVKEEMKKWEPKKNSNATMDPYKTLFVSRLDKESTAKKLKRIFEEFGPVKDVRLIHDTKTGVSRNYAFIEFEKIDDFKSILSLLTLLRRI